MAQVAPRLPFSDLQRPVASGSTAKACPNHRGARGEFQCAEPIAVGRSLLSDTSFQTGAYQTPACGGLFQKTALTRVYAAAKATAMRQGRLVLDIFNLVKRFQSVGQWKAVLFLEHQRYDETPLDLRVVS